MEEGWWRALKEGSGVAVCGGEQRTMSSPTWGRPQLPTGRASFMNVFYCFRHNAEAKGTWRGRIITQEEPESINSRRKSTGLAFSLLLHATLVTISYTEHTTNINAVTKIMSATFLHPVCNWETSRCRKIAGVIWEENEMFLDFLNTIFFFFLNKCKYRLKLHRVRLIQSKILKTKNITRKKIFLGWTRFFYLELYSYKFVEGKR